MAKATFSNMTPPQQPTHYKGRTSGWIYWKAEDCWYQASRKGEARPLLPDRPTPYTYPNEFEPCYGDLVITISFD